MDSAQWDARESHPPSSSSASPSRKRDSHQRDDPDDYDAGLEKLQKGTDGQPLYPDVDSGSDVEELNFADWFNELDSSFKEEEEDDE